MNAGAPEPPRFRLPDRPPSPADIENLDRFTKLAANSLADVRMSADKWRTGLAALVTLVTGGLLIKGPSAASELTTEWRVVLTVLAGGGLACAMYGLWCALRAAAGVPRRQDFQQTIDSYQSVLIYELAQADRAAASLRRARIALIVALPLLGAAVIAWWWSGTKPSSPPAFLEIDLPAPEAPLCGVLKSADNEHLRIQVAGEEYPRMISFARIRNMHLKTNC